MSRLEEALVEELLDSLCLFEPLRDEAGAVRDFALCHANRAAREELGNTAEPLVGRSFGALLPGLQEALDPGVCLRVMAGEPLRRDGLPVRGFHGGAPQDAVLALRAFAVGDRLALTWRDVSSAPRTAQIEELEERVRLRTVELETFNHSVSHDLRSPLQGILGYAELLASEYAEVLDEDALRMLGNIEKAAERMYDLIQDLLLFGRVGRADLELEQVDVAAIAREVAHEVRESLPHDRKPEIRLGELGTVLGDPHLLRIVLLQLLQNAAKYSRDRSPGRVEILRAGDRICVRDNGVGFDPAEAGKLFQPFVRLDPAFQGTGLGLAIVRRILVRHGGEVGAEARPGEGATFWFRVPSSEGGEPPVPW